MIERTEQPADRGGIVILTAQERAELVGRLRERAARWKCWFCGQALIGRPGIGATCPTCDAL